MDKIPIIFQLFYLFNQSNSFRSSKKMFSPTSVGLPNTVKIGQRLSMLLYCVYRRASFERVAVKTVERHFCDFRFTTSGLTRSLITGK